MPRELMYLCARVYYCLCCAYDRPNPIAHAHTRTQQLLRTRHGGRGLAARVSSALTPPPPPGTACCASTLLYSTRREGCAHGTHTHKWDGLPLLYILLESTHTNTHTQTNTQSTLYHAYVSHRQCVGLSLNANRARPYFISLLYPHINAFGAPPPGVFSIYLAYPPPAGLGVKAADPRRGSTVGWHIFDQ